MIDDDLNQVRLVGKIAGRVFFNEGPKTSVARFNIETRRGMSAERQGFAERNPVVAFGQLGNAIARMAEGSRIAILGHLTTRSWVSKKDGQTKWGTEVVVDSIEDERSLAAPPIKQEPPKQQPLSPLPPSEDPDQDIPF